MPHMATIDPHHHSTNRVVVPTGLLASAEFNDAPVALHIAGVHETNRGLFGALAAAPDAGRAAEVFQDYMAVVFGLDAQDSAPGAPRRRRASYSRLLRGWGFDSSSPEAAVLKGWVESRFGLLPTFHRTVLGRFPSPAWITYVEQKMASRFHDNTINLQLDLLYEYCQWALARFFQSNSRHITLYRGVNGFDEHAILARDGKQATVRQNNLVSFSSSRDRAGEFGDTILTARVPLVKVLFFNDLLPRHALKAEGEWLVIGGDYRVEVGW